MKKRVLAATLAAVLAVGALAGCGGKETVSDEKTITVGASSTPHAEILEAATQILAEKGYTLEFADGIREDSIEECNDKIPKAAEKIAELCNIESGFHFKVLDVLKKSLANITDFSLFLVK